MVRESFGENAFQNLEMYERFEIGLYELNKS